MISRNAKVVIGANFGDEGKGLAVDALAAADPAAVVVRFNGGAQAGHTVTHDDVRRHVFSHFGAGTFAGATTFLSRFFIVHPGLFAREAAELRALGVRPRVFVDPDARVTTPYDVLVNRWVEETRGGARHGSVGIGFGETIERCEHGHGLAVRDLGDPDQVRSVATRIRDTWLPARLQTLGVPLDQDRERQLADPQVMASFLEEIRLFRRAVAPASIDAALGRRPVVFEGAQGLLLDQDRGFTFPYVTRSNTGLKNVLALAEDAGIEHLDVIYMTRAYLTRHGAGPLRNETPRLAFADVVDPTNQPNPWQGILRFAPLDLDFLRDTIAADLRDATASSVAVDAAIGITCLDQLRDDAEVYRGTQPDHVPAAQLPAAISEAVGLPVTLESAGPCRAAVRLRRMAASSNPMARPVRPRCADVRP